MSKQRKDERLRLGRIFIEAWAECMDRGWREHIGHVKSNLDYGEYIISSDDEGCITQDDVDIVNKIIESQDLRVRDAVKYYFRRRGIYSYYNSFKKVSEKLNYVNSERCIKDIECVELIIYGQFYLKIGELKHKLIVIQNEREKLLAQ